MFGEVLQTVSAGRSQTCLCGTGWSPQPQPHCDYYTPKPTSYTRDEGSCSESESPLFGINAYPALPPPPPTPLLLLLLLLLPALIRAGLPWNRAPPLLRPLDPALIPDEEKVYIATSAGPAPPAPAPVLLPPPLPPPLPEACADPPAPLGSGPSMIRFRHVGQLAFTRSHSSTHCRYKQSKAILTMYVWALSHGPLPVCGIYVNKTALGPIRPAPSR